VCNNDAAARCVNIGGDSLKNEGDRGSDREKAVLKVESVDVIVNRPDFLNASFIYTIMARVAVTFQEMLPI
jgi:hypothetical protein